MRLFTLLLLVFHLNSCKTMGRSAAELSAEDELLESPQQILDNPAWTQYTAETMQSYDIQDACRPASFQHKGELRGVVVLFHEFTACPQQYFDLAQKLQNEGYDVLLPLNPGHGKRRDTDSPEQAELPTKDNFDSVMPAFVKRINDIVRAYPAPHKVVGGLSLGGTYATAAMVNDPVLYERGLIMVPLYKVSTAISDILGGIKNFDNFEDTINPEHMASLTRQILGQSIGWGESCEKETRRGRQGICNFDFTHLVAAQQFGYDMSRASILKGKVQFIAVEGDLAVDVDRLTWVFDKKTEEPETRKQLCFYRKPASHSLASRYDNPDENKFWMDAFERSVVNFVVKGEFFSTTGKKIKGYSECKT